MKVVHSKLVISTVVRRAKRGSENLHNLHNLLNLLIFCSLRSMEVLGLCRRILHSIHRAKLLDLGDGGTVKRQTMAGLRSRVSAQTEPLQGVAYLFRTQT